MLKSLKWFIVVFVIFIPALVELDVNLSYHRDHSVCIAASFEVREIGLE